MFQTRSFLHIIHLPFLLRSSRKPAERGHNPFVFNIIVYDTGNVHRVTISVRIFVQVESIPGTGEPGGLPSMGSHRVGHDWSDLAVAAAAAESIDHEKINVNFPR